MTAPTGRAMWIDVHADHPRPSISEYAVVERVAEAIRSASWELDGRDPLDRPWASASRDAREHYRRLALAALTAMEKNR